MCLPGYWLQRYACIDVLHRDDVRNWCARLRCKHLEELLCLQRKLLVLLRQTRRERKWDLTTWTCERNGVNLILAFTTSTGTIKERGSRDEKGLHKTWLTGCLLTGAKSGLHDVLRSDWRTGLSLGATFLDIGRTFLEKGVTVQ